MGVGVGVGVGNGVEVGVGNGVEVGVGVGVGPGVATKVGVGVGIAVAEGTGVGVGVAEEGAMLATTNRSPNINTVALVPSWLFTPCQLTAEPGMSGWTSMETLVPGTYVPLLWASW